ncbi:hypothetical protein BRD03_05780 [Halobacteriales archaeon QS_9_68_17]|nr:MAG: hypothetical protein BRD03_05780 [Halobacteriales archaeon QS_9_68_17]
MSRRTSQRRALRILGLIAAVGGLIGFTVFGWEFGGSDSTVATVVGVAFAALAVAVMLYDRFV